LVSPIPIGLITLNFRIKNGSQNFTTQSHDFREITIAAMKSAFLPHIARRAMIKNIADELETEFKILPEYIEQKK
jgi:hypothetical protein